MQYYLVSRLLFVWKQRKIEPEVLDSSPPDVARRNLADLVRINRFFGGHAVVRNLFQRARPPQTPFTVLDIGAASGDTARLLSSTCPHARVFSLDLHPVNLSEAPHPKLIADAFTLPFAEASIDYVMSSLFLHHFTDDQAVQLLREFNRVAKRGVLLADLERSIWPYLFIGYTHPVFKWGEITVHDGKISVRAAFRKYELEKVAKQAGLNPDIQQHRPAFRLAMVALK